MIGEVFIETHMHLEPVPQIFQVVRVVWRPVSIWDEQLKMVIQTVSVPEAAVQCVGCSTIQMVTGFGRRSAECCGNVGHFKLEMGPGDIPECGLVAADILVSEPIIRSVIPTRFSSYRQN